MRKYCMHSKYVYRPIPNISTATKIRLREHFTAEIFYRRKYPELRYNGKITKIVITDFNCFISTYKPFLSTFHSNNRLAWLAKFDPMLVVMETNVDKLLYILTTRQLHQHLPFLEPRANVHPVLPPLLSSWHFDANCMASFMMISMIIGLL